jgi:hypothetical protein
VNLLLEVGLISEAVDFDEVVDASVYEAVAGE